MSFYDSSASKNNIKKILILMRHGEKIVKIGKIPKGGKFDSELSPLGIKQSFLAGQKFISQLKKFKFSDISPSEIHIICSPYLRTLQTTSHFLKGIESLNYFNNNQELQNLYNISIDFGVREILNENKLKKEEEIPKKFLNLLNNPNYEDFDEELKNLKIEFISKYEFPTEKENYFTCLKRCKKYIEEDLTNFVKTNKYKIIIIVSHSGPMMFLMRNLGFYEKNVKNILVSEQYYFDISEGIDKARFIEKV